MALLRMFLPPYSSMLNTDWTSSGTFRKYLKTYPFSLTIILEHRTASY